MNKSQIKFLEALRVSLRGEQVEWKNGVNAKEWEDILLLADQHHILPMIYNAVYACPAFFSLNPQRQRYYKYQTIFYVTRQISETADFLALLQKLQEKGLQPIVVKGIVCRNLYPAPDDRMSADEDLFAPDGEFAPLQDSLINLGLTLSGGGNAPENKKEQEISFYKNNSPLYLELHRELFPSESGAYGNLNRYFKNSQNRTEEIRVQGIRIRTLNKTDHFFYLICHALKHFLHSGFGIRQVCDLLLFAETYGAGLDWDRIRQQCLECHADVFAAALLKIGERYLGFLPEKAGVPEDWRNFPIDENDLLADLLDSGVYGGTTRSRLHSSRITLQAVEDDAEKQKTSKTLDRKSMARSLLHAAFPPYAELKQRYSYLKRAPFLLPVAWLVRLFRYEKEVRQSDSSNLRESLELGSKRVKLLKEYHIIEDSSTEKRSNRSARKQMCRK